jgi:hypothetical protein
MGRPSSPQLFGSTFSFAASNNPLSEGPTASDGNSSLASLYLELKRQTAESLAEAKRHYAAYDDAATLEVLRGMPEDLRDHDLERLAQERFDQGEKLK